MLSLEPHLPNFRAQTVTTEKPEAAYSPEQTKTPSPQPSSDHFHGQAALGFTEVTPQVRSSADTWYMPRMSATISIIIMSQEQEPLWGPPSQLRAYLVAQPVKNLPAMRETWVQSLGQEDSPGEVNGCPLKYSCLRIPWIEECDGLQSRGS